MSFMLSLVVYSAAILFVLISVQAVAGLSNNGLKWGLGARDGAKDPTVFQGRALRTVQNHIEGMMLFVPLALAAHMAGISGDLLVKGGWLYLIGRVLYPLTYWTGLPYARTLVWALSLVGTLMVFAQIVMA